MHLHRETVSTMFPLCALHAEWLLYKYLIPIPHLVHPLPHNNDSLKLPPFHLPSSQLFVCPSSRLPPSCSTNTSQLTSINLLWHVRSLYIGLPNTQLWILTHIHTRQSPSLGSQYLLQQ